MLTPKELGIVAGMATDVVEGAARHILRPAFASGARDIHKKSDGSLVTEADLACQAMLKEGLAVWTPEIPVIGEEDDPETLPETFWIVDPLDGTGPFTRGEPTYGVMAALVIDSQTRLGILHQPETATTAVAIAGRGTFLNGQRVWRPRPTSLATGARIAFACRGEDARWESVLAEGAPGYRKRTNSLDDYLQLLTGVREGTFYSEGVDRLGRGKCPPWDHAAGVLAVKEAGGVAALPYADGVLLEASPRAWHNRLLVATTEALFDEVRSHVHSRAPELCRPRVRQRVESTMTSI